MLEIEEWGLQGDWRPRVDLLVVFWLETQSYVTDRRCCAERRGRCRSGVDILRIGRSFAVGT